MEYMPTRNMESLFILIGWLCMKLGLVKAWCLWSWWMRTNAVIKFELAYEDAVIACLPNDALMSHKVVRTSTSNFSLSFFNLLPSFINISFSFCAYGSGQTIHFGTAHPLFSGATSSQWKQTSKNGWVMEVTPCLFKKRNIGLNTWNPGYTKQPVSLWSDSYLRGFQWGPGWWCQEVAPGGCTWWWWWMGCWGWCCYLSCRVKYRVSCCNTVHTAPDQRLDNWDSPVK